MRWKASAAAMLVAGAIFIVGLGSFGLVEPSDARYAEIANEMWCSGDYVVPRLLGIPHFHKPPLIYWLTTAGYAVLGENEWGARICQGVLGLALVGLILRFSRRHLGEKSAPFAVLLLAATPAVVGAVRGLTTDLLLATCQTLVLTSWYDVRTGKGDRFSKLAFYLGLGLVILAKGPIGCLVVFLIIGLFSWRRRGMSARLVRWRVALGTLLVLAVALPWYLLVVVKTPGLLEYFLRDQLGSRLVEGGKGHPHPFFYYLYVFPALGLPWILLAPAGLVRLRDEAAGTATFLTIWALVPPLLFSIPSSKLPLYVLISYPALAMLAARAVVAREGPRRLVRVIGGLFLLIGLALATLAFVEIPLSSGDLEGLTGSSSRLLLLPLSVVTLAAGLFAVVRTRPRETGNADCRAAVIALVLALGFIPAWVSSQGDAVPLRSVRSVGLAVREFREPAVLVEYRDLTGALPFYSRRLPLLAGIEREVQFGEAQRLLSPEDFQALWKGTQPVLVVTRTKHADDLSGGRILLSANGYSLLFNR